jgi:4-coumarate--CoA ligase
MYTAMQFQYGPDLELRQRVKLMLLPMFHVYGLVIVTFCQLQRGSTVVSLPKYELELALRTIEKYRVTDFPAVPPIVLALAKQKVVGNYDLSSLVELTSGAAPLGKDLMQEVARLFPSLRIRQVWALSGSNNTVSVSHLFQLKNLFHKPSRCLKNQASSLQ